MKSVRILSFLGALLIVGSPLAGTALLQDPNKAQPDSSSLHQRAKNSQARFERSRNKLIPPHFARLKVNCDEIVGRFCFRHENWDEDPSWEIMEEPIPVEMARAELLGDLVAINVALPGDNWVLGQLIYYLSEERDWKRAEELLSGCQATPWWCNSLLGFIAHSQSDWMKAEHYFGLALNQMPSEAERSFRSFRYLVDSESQELLAVSTGTEAAQNLFWLLSDPLYLVDGNDRMTEQHVRSLLVYLRKDSANPYGLSWGDDLEELTVRYGAEKAWEREQQPPDGFLTDTRNIVGRHHPKSQEFLPPKFVLQNPAETESEWSLERENPRTGYAPPYAPNLKALTAQIGRFRRGDSLMIVTAFRPEEDSEINQETKTPQDTERAQIKADNNPFLVPIPQYSGSRNRETDLDQDSFQSGLFLHSLSDQDSYRVLGTDSTAKSSILVPNGSYVIGLEILDKSAKKAWRIRRGLWQESLTPGLTSLSDLLILSGAGTVPSTLEEAIPQIKPRLTIQSGEPIKLAWEIYGLRNGETLNTRIGIAREKVGIFRRLGEFMRLLESDTPTEMSFQDINIDGIGTVFRAIHIDLPDLETGHYTITVELEPSGREKMLLSRNIAVVN